MAIENDKHASVSSDSAQHIPSPSDGSPDGPSHSDTGGGVVAQAQRRCPPINYELAVWIVYGVITALAIADRFTWNVWPRETYRIGRGTAGSDFTGGLKAGPWSVKMYDAIARISGRFDIVALNLLMFTMMHSFFSWISETWLARHVIDFSDYVDANRRLHKWNGIAIIVATLSHVWSILVPCIVDGWRAQVVLGVFEWPLSERGPKGFKDINNETRTMSLQGDDVFRIIEMTILLGVLMPLSVRWFSTRWHIGIHIHSVINVLYFIDIVRRHTHPHSWILNTPFFLAWAGDLIIGIFWRRRMPDIYSKQLSADYILLFWHQSKMLETVGPKYFLRMRESSCLERAHVFTALENRLGLDLADGKPWSACLLIRVYNSKRSIRIWRQDEVSHTSQLVHSTDMYTWGPFLGSMSEKAYRAMHGSRASRAMALIGGGSAAGYILDALQQRRDCSLTVMYTTRDQGLWNWVLKCVQDIGKTGLLAQTRVYLALTHGQDGGDEDCKARISRMQSDLDSDGESHSSYSTGGAHIQLIYGRLTFEDHIPDGCVAYFQGSSSLQSSVKKACSSKKSVRFVAGPAYDQDSKKNRYLRDRIRMKCFRNSSGEA